MRWQYQNLWKSKSLGRRRWRPLADLRRLRSGWQLGAQNLPSSRSQHFAGAEKMRRQFRLKAAVRKGSRFCFLEADLKQRTRALCERQSIGWMGQNAR